MHELPKRVLEHGEEKCFRCSFLPRIHVSGRHDVLAAVQALRSLGLEFVESGAAHSGQRGAISKTYLGGVLFELVHSDTTPGVAP